MDNFVQPAGKPNTGAHTKSVTALKTTGLLIAVAAAVSGCTTGAAGSNPGGNEPAGSNTTIRTVINADPDSFLAPAVRAGAAEAINGLLYSTLVYADTDNQIVGGLATSWESTPTHATFTLRGDATCADGTKITPTTVKNSLEAFSDPKTGSRNATIVFGPQVPKISADDATGTVKIDLSQPWSDMLQGLTTVHTGIVCPAGLTNPKETAAGRVEAAFSGPYVLSKASPGSEFEFTLRENFKAWPEYAKPLEGKIPETITYTINGDISSVANALLTKTLDIGPVAGKAESRFEGQKGFTTNVIPKASVFILFNEREGSIFADQAKRRAVAQALNRESFIKAATGGPGEPATSFVPTTVECSNTDESLLQGFDSSAATKALDGMKINLLGTHALGANGAGNTFVETALREAGAEVRLQNVDNSTWATELATKPEAWDITVYPLINPTRTIYGAVASLAGPISEDGGRNHSGTTKPDVIKSVGQAMAMDPGEERCGVYQDMQQTMLERVDFVPLAQAQQLNVVRDGFSMRTINGTAVPLTMRISE